jgi:hypothetical protein
MTREAIRIQSSAGAPARPHGALDAANLAAVVGGDTTPTKTPPVRATFSELVVNKVVDASST